MKNLIRLICFICFFSVINPIAAQESNSILDLNSPLYDRAEDQLSNTDTIPDYRSKTNKLKLTGIIYQSDGITPAKDVILFIEQPDEDGDFDLRKTGEDRYVFHRSWVKTDADGRYTLYTFVPGGDRRYKQLQQIFPLIKAPTQQIYEVDTFLFDEDPLLTKACRKRMAKKGDATRILKLKSLEGMYVAERNIILKEDLEIARS
jgi:protocatechuate 3,4-dioxygenase beta subunit